MNTTTWTRTISPAMAALAGATLLASLGVSIATVALPAMARDFTASVPQIRWIVLAYLISVTATIVMAGRLGDLLGDRRVLLAGLVLFAAASGLCAFAPSLSILIGARAAQGVGGAVLLALPLSLAREAVAKQRLGSAMGMLGSMSAVGTALGPSLGGLIVSGPGWRSAFAATACLALLVLGVAWHGLPSPLPPQRRPDRRTDWPGFGLLSITLALYALATSAGWTAAGTGMLMAAAGATLMLFVAVEARSAAPLVPLATLGEREIRIALTTNLLANAVMMSTLVVGPFFLSYGLALDTAAVGLVMAVGPITAALFGVPAGRLTDRFGCGPVRAAGLIQMALGLACLALLPGAFDTIGYVLALIVLTPGFQLFLAANSTAAMMEAKEQQRGMLSGLLGLSRNIGLMTGASVMPALFAATIGTDEIEGAAPGAIADAFTTTFLVAAGLTLLALGLTCLRGRTEQR